MAFLIYCCRPARNPAATLPPLLATTNRCRMGVPATPLDSCIGDGRPGRLCDRESHRACRRKRRTPPRRDQPVGRKLPQVCYHQQLGPIQTCDTCIVSVNGSFVHACAAVVGEGMRVAAQRCQPRLPNPPAQLPTQNSYPWYLVPPILFDGGRGGRI